MNIRFAKFSILLAGSALISLPAIAQDKGETQAGESSGYNSQEIIVTAQRRQESVLTVPLSIQAITGEQLADKGIKDLTSLQFTTPGYLPNTGSGFTQIFIRGIGNTLFVGADPSVATFIDDVPRIYGTMAHNLVDVERVEVLKGAQGGLYGRNSTGGVVNIITRTPSTKEVAGDFRLSYGEKNSFETSGYLNFPLGEHAALSLSAERDSHDPYVKNIAKANPYTAAMFPTGSSFGTPQQTADFFNAAVDPSPLHDQDFWAARAKLLLEPTDNFSLTISGDYYDKHDNNGQGQVNTTPAYTQAVVAGLFAGLGIDTNLPAGFLQTSGKFEAAEGAPASVNTSEYGVSAVAKLALDGIDLTSISAYRHQKTSFVGDSALTDVPTVIPIVSYPYKKFIYQELRALSTFDGPFSFIAGATYLQSKLRGSTELFMLSPEIPLSETGITQMVDNWSAYAQASYNFTDALKLTVSGRYIHETNKSNFYLPVISNARSTDEKFVPSATLSYGLDHGTVYARWARGFKPGGINLIVAPIFFPRPNDGSIFGPETVDTFEVGYRQALAGGQLQLTTAAFYNDYKNLQVSTRSTPAYPAIITAVINAKSARTYGFEVGLNWKVAPPLTIGVNAGYLNAKYKDFALSGSAVIADFDLGGQQMTNAPKWQMSFNAALDQPLNDRIRLAGNVLVTHTSKVIHLYSALPGFLPNAIGPGYWLVNARLGVKTADDKYAVAIVADNLFNKGYFTSGTSLAFGNSSTWGDRRIIRAEFTMKF